MQSRFEKFTYCINAIDLHWHRIASAAMKKYGLKGGSAIYFTQLLNYPEGITAAELGALCGKDKADVSRELSGLEKAGLVSRSGGYRSSVRLTEQGTALAHEIISKANKAVEIVGQTLTEEERSTFYTALDKITQRIQALSEQGLPD